jgi:hypothetical protein
MVTIQQECQLSEKWLWHTTMMLTESNKGSKANNKGLVKQRLVGRQYKLSQAKMDMWPRCTQQMRQRKQIIAVGQETMALATGNMKWWCDTLNNVTALSSLRSALYMDVQMKRINQYQRLSYYSYKGSVDSTCWQATMAPTK